jgi:hypothetical protein
MVISKNRSKATSQVVKLVCIYRHTMFIRQVQGANKI